MDWKFSCGQVLDLVEDSVVIRDLEGRFIGWNRAAEKLYGISREAVLGQRAQDLFEDWIHRPLPSAEPVLGSPNPQRELVKRKVQGRGAALNLTCVSEPLLDAAGVVVATAEVSRVITTDPTSRWAELFRLHEAQGATIMSMDAATAMRLLSSIQLEHDDLRVQMHSRPHLVQQVIDATQLAAYASATGLNGHEGSQPISLRTLWPEESAACLADLLVTVLQDQLPTTVSCKLSRQDGTLYDAQVTALQSTCSSEGEQILLSIRDVSENVEKLASLEASEARYRKLFEYMPIALTQVDASGLVELFGDLRSKGVGDLSAYIDEHPEFMDIAMNSMIIEEVNQTNADLFLAKSRDDMRGPITRYWSSGLPTLRKSLEARYRGEDFFQEEAQLTRLDGTLVDVLYAASRHSTLPNKSLVAFMDISDRKRAERALKRSERRYRDLFQAMTVSFWELDLSGVHQAFGGEVQDYEDDLVNFLRSKPEYTERILRSAVIVDVNDQTMALFKGAEKSDLLRSLDVFWGQDHRTEGAAAILSVLRNDASVTIETRLRRLTGEEFDAQFTLWFSSDDRRRGLAAVTDITERVNAFNELEQSEQRFRDLFQHLPVPVLQVNSSDLLDRFQNLKREGVSDLSSYIEEHPEFVWTAMESTIIERANEAAKKVLGVPDTGGVDSPITPLWKNHPDVYARLLLNRYADVTAYEEEVRLTTFDGRTKEGTLTVTFPPSLARHGVTINAFVDATERKDAERRLRQIEAEYAHAARISMLGELTASIAHEVNQPLAAITTYGAAGLRLLTRQDQELSEFQDIMTRIVSDAQRAAGVIARVRNMASQRKMDEELIPLEELIRDAVGFLAHELKLHGVKIEILSVSAKALVKVDRIQLQQVIVNLIINAVQAIVNTNTERRHIRITTAVDEAQVTCTVEDSGPGISPDDADQIFQSFVTTKSGGMGMGLPISRSIIEAHEGQLTAGTKSSLGGAVFVFTLPRHDTAGNTDSVTNHSRSAFEAKR